MSDNRIWLFDTTLRDGGQTRGVDFSKADKIAISAALDEIGIDYIEGGWPGANPTDDAFFGDPPKTAKARMVAFGMTRRGGRSTANDPGLNAVLDAEVPATCLVGKTWDFHVETAINTTLDENLEMIRQSVAAAAERGRESMFDCEHFFDGYKNNPDYALDCVRAAHEGGASWVVLCDTNGGALPNEVFEIVSAVHAALPEVRLGIHCHNDAGVAVANSLAAIRAGARQVQGTINGLGERCGNADLITLIPTLVLKLGYETGISEESLPKLMGLSRMLDERLNRPPYAQAPYVGEAAFAHKGGLHASAAQKDPRTYEHVPPEKVGNSRQYLVSDQAGKSNMMARFAEFGIEISNDDPRLDNLIRVVKEREFEGWAFDSAEASFELLARRTLGEVPDYFTIGRFRVMDERRFNARGQLVVESEATATITVGNVVYHEVALGNGPVNAVDTALRKALSTAYPTLEDVELVDYKVRILDAREGQSGTGAVTRVMIEFRTPDGTIWRTVGVSTNIIDASVVALGDGMMWKLQRDGISGPATAA
ncbi:MAG: citramalate synthase [Pseudomonadota bacterium]|nr:citramalate synthase [Pseudomonadota bacterium]MEC7495587.1 citramalate synthase [Pseudomonadota bacterium]MEC8129243.1 citramalate synthase [Pseudomonadota bacterium]MEC8514973.1 citramalate synthase [Pseudomonadota bacterium]MEC8549361.1 citramalate synthase [Pseudomonadota bacterium]